MLSTNRDTSEILRARVQRFGQMHTAAMPRSAAAWARALFVEHDLGPLLEDSSGTLYRRLATFGWVALGSEACRPHHIQNPGAIAATQAQRNRTSIFEDIISCPLLADRKLRIHRFA